jgi:L-rhamnose-H+ transport protein
MSESIGLGLGLVLLGGLLQGSFALPMNRMRAWHWENIWLVYAVAGFVVIPWALVGATVPSFTNVLHRASGTTLAEVAVFGFGWGVGSTLCGLGIKRVGMALSFAIILGITASFGSLLPLVVLQPGNLMTRQGHALMAGLLLVILGISLCALAGHRRERELSQATQFGGSGFWWGLVICVLSGIFSPMLNFSFVFGKELQKLTILSGAKPAMASNLIWAVALTAGFIVNAGYCVYLLQKNRTWGLLIQKDIPSLYWLGATLMGILWFAGIAVYGIGAADMGALGAVMGWPLFMAIIIITANLWGAMTGEWKGTSKGTYIYSLGGIAVLVVAIYVISRGGA